MKIPDSNTIAELANDVAEMRFAELRTIAETHRAELVAQRIQDMSRNEFGDLIAELLDRDIEFVNLLKECADNSSEQFPLSSYVYGSRAGLRIGKLIHDRADYLVGDECVEQEAERLGREG